jgi:hypothetical protein
VFVGACRPVTVGASRVIEMNIRLQPMTRLDLPILLALPELDSLKLPELAQAV